MNKLLAVLALSVCVFYNPNTTGTVEIESATPARLSAGFSFLKPLVDKVTEVVAAPAPSYKATTPMPGEHLVGVIKFNVEVTAASAAAAIKALNEMNAAGAEVILMVFDTPGGSVYAGQRLAQAMEESKAKIVCNVDLLAASMGGYLLGSCQERYMVKRAEILFHEPSVHGMEISGNPKDVHNQYERMRSLAEAMLEQYARKSKLSKEDIRKHIENGQDWWLNWEEALRFGFVEGIVDSTPSLYRSLVKTGRAQSALLAD